MSEMQTQISSAITGLTREFNVIAHNLANVSTVGYKRRYHTFSKTLMNQGAVPAKGTRDEIDLHSILDFSQGSFIETGRSLDFALGGKGFFMLETPDGPLYTRDGKFLMNKDRQIVDSAGRIVAGESGAITLPADVDISQLNVSTDGNITAEGLSVGKFKFVDFKENEATLSAVGFNCFQAPKNIKPELPENLIVKQGYQEGSNVEMVEELVDMVMVTRLYEANMKFLTTGSESTKSLMSVATS